MTQCDSISSSLTAWIDGELSPAEHNAVAEHLAGCPSCAREADRLKQSVIWQTQVMPSQLLDAEVDIAALRMSLRRRLNAVRRQEEEAARPIAWTWFIRPLSFATAALALVLFIAVWRVGEPESLLVSLGVEAPPAEVATDPDMFKYLEVIENLDALEHFEAVQAVSLEDERANLGDLRHG